MSTKVSVGNLPFLIVAVAVAIGGMIFQIPTTDGQEIIPENKTAEASSSETSSPATEISEELAPAASAGLSTNSNSASNTSSTTLSTAATTSTLLRDQLAGANKRWSVTAEVGAQSNLQSQDSVTYAASSYVAVTPRVNLTNDLNLTARITGSQELTGATQSTLENTRFTLSTNPQKLSRDLSWFPSLSADAPTNLIDRKENSFQGAAGLRSTGIYSTSILKQPITFISYVDGRRNLHEFERNINNSANLQYVARGLLAAETTVFKKISLTLYGSYTHGWTYQDSTRELYSLGQEISFRLPGNVSVGIGHTNADNVFAPDGRNTNVAVFSDITSQVYGYVTGTY